MKVKVLHIFLREVGTSLNKQQIFGYVTDPPNWGVCRCPGPFNFLHHFMLCFGPKPCSCPMEQTLGGRLTAPPTAKLPSGSSSSHGKGPEALTLEWLALQHMAETYTNITIHFVVQCTVYLKQCVYQSLRMFEHCGFQQHKRHISGVPPWVSPWPWAHRLPARSQSGPPPFQAPGRHGDHLRKCQARPATWGRSPHVSRQKYLL